MKTRAFVLVFLLDTSQGYRCDPSILTMQTSFVVEVPNCNSSFYELFLSFLIKVAKYVFASESRAAMERSNFEGANLLIAYKEALMTA